MKKITEIINEMEYNKEYKVILQLNGFHYTFAKDKDKAANNAKEEILAKYNGLELDFKIEIVSVEEK